jgi:hypothetical protein
MNRFASTFTGWLTMVLLFLALAAGTGCGSPQEKAYKRAMKNYQRGAKDARAYAKEQETQLVAVSRVFCKISGRWPYSAAELGFFADKERLKFNEYAFKRMTFATMPDGSAQVSYEVDCSRFDTHEYTYRMPGNVRIPPP